MERYVDSKGNIKVYIDVDSQGGKISLPPYQTVSLSERWRKEGNNRKGDQVVAGIFKDWTSYNSRGKREFSKGNAGNFFYNNFLNTDKQFAYDFSDHKFK